jgi:hypothetical protein
LRACIALPISRENIKRFGCDIFHSTRQKNLLLSAVMKKGVKIYNFGAGPARVIFSFHVPLYTIVYQKKPERETQMNPLPSQPCHRPGKFSGSLDFY